MAAANAGRSLAESAQDTLHHIDDILGQNAKPLNTAITGIAEFAEMLGRNSKRVEGLIGGLETLTGSGAPKQGPATYDLTAGDGLSAGSRRPSRVSSSCPTPAPSFCSTRRRS